MYSKCHAVLNTSDISKADKTKTEVDGNVCLDQSVESNEFNYLVTRAVYH